jgi:cell division protein FtsQ
VEIIERQPYVLWQHQGDIKVVDAAGAAIIDADPLQFTQLTLFVGETAAIQAADMRQMMGEFPNIASRVDSFVNVSGRRWDMVLDDGAVRVMLPETNMRTALRGLQNLQAQTQILDRKIETIDMRLPNRLTLSPTSPEQA